MDVDSQTWILLYNRLKDQYQAKRRFAQTISTLDQKDMLDQITQLEKQLNVMKDTPMEYEITISEIGRRQFITESLKKHINTLAAGTDSIRSSLASNNGTTSRASLTTPTNGSSSTISNTSGSAPSTFNPLATSDRALIQRQQEVIKMQDEMLGDIEKGVDRLQIQAKEIGEEAKVHKKILEELDTHVDDATEKLREETKHTERVKQYTNDCYAYMCIILEVIILVILILVAFVHI